MSSDLPRYDDLPPAADGGRSAWHVFGDDDELGLVNLLTPARVVSAARLVRTGRVFPMDLPWGSIDPPLNPARGLPRHTVVDQPGGIGHDDVWDNVWPQAGSQWDSLAHIGYDRARYYNGATAADIRGRGRNGIDRWAEHGLVARAVLLDVPAAFAALGRPYDPAATIELGVEELEAARRLAGVEFEPGDVVLLHTGFTGWYAGLSSPERKQVPRELRNPGLEHSEAVCRYLWDAHVAGIAADNSAVEAWPADTSPGGAPFGFIHQMLIGSFGMALGELWWLHDLAMDCAATGVYEGMLVSAPARAPGGISSPANAVVLR